MGGVGCFWIVPLYRRHKVRYALLATLPNCADDRLALLGLLVPGDKMKWTDPVPFARDMITLARPLRLLGRWRPPKDRLYRVATSRTVRGDYLVTRYSPAVRKRIHILARRAEYCRDLGDLFSCRAIGAH